MTRRLATICIRNVMSFAFGLVLLVRAVPAQEKQSVPSSVTTKDQKTLTNADILSMMKAGLPESTIVLSIQHSATSFDTSPQGLIVLKKQGVTAKILDAMLSVKTIDRTESKGAPVSSTGNVSGKILGILNNGDLKPARLATVYFFFFLEPTKKIPLDKRVMKGPGRIYSVTQLDYLVANQDLNLKNGEIEARCAAELRGYAFAANTAWEWALENNPMEARQAQADEEGEFTFKKVPPGVWIAVSLGRMGLNNAAWEVEVTVEAGKTVSLKMNEPKVACLDLQ